MKTVLITGASGAIGSAAALEFAQNGYKVAAVYNKNESEAAEICEKIESLGGQAVKIQADVTSESAVERMFSEAEQKLGFIEVLVNNAGISKIGLLTDLTLAEWNEIFSVNITSAFLCSKRALVPMIREKCGSIINISSMWGQVGASCEVAYSASKAAMIGFTKALAKEEGPSGIRVNCIAPGVIKSRMNAQLSEEDISAICEETPLGIIGKGEDVAKAAVFMAENKFVTGEVLAVNGGLVI